MKKMDKAAESKILQGLNKVADYVNDGTTPNDAIVKAASELALPPGHITLMVNAYNTGRTTRQRLSGSDPLTKAAEFELADASMILERLYPSDVKTAAASYNENVVSAEYTLPPTFIKRRDSLEKAARAMPTSTMEKGAHVGFTEVEKPAAYPREDRAFEKVSNALRFDKQRLEMCRGELTAAKTQLTQDFEKLAEYFAQPGSLPFGDVRRVALLTHGQTGVAVFNQLARTRPRLEKQAATGRLVQTAEAPFALVSKIVKLAEALKAATTTYQELEAQLAEKHAKALEPHANPTVPSVLEGFLPKQAGIVLPTVATIATLKNLLTDVGKNISAAPPAAKVDKMLLDLDDPTAKQQYRATSASIMVNDLMTNDPEIGKYDAEDVTEAYNEIAEAAPRAANNRLLMQGLLRRRLEQGFMDPYDVSQSVLKPEQQMIDRQAKPDPETVPGLKQPSLKKPEGESGKDEKGDKDKKKSDGKRDGDGDGKVNDGTPKERAA